MALLESEKAESAETKFSPQEGLFCRFSREDFIYSETGKSDLKPWKGRYLIHKEKRKN